MSRGNKKLWNDIIPEQITYTQESISLRYTIFFHPDCTVGLGISPNHALRLVGFTTGGESHPALKILIQLRLVYTIDSRLSILLFKKVKRSVLSSVPIMPHSDAAHQALYVSDFCRSMR